MTGAASPGADGIPRCPWGILAAKCQAYHDTEWGRPSDREDVIFEQLCLAGFQSGLSWPAIRRENARAVLALRERGISLAGLVWSFEAPARKPPATMAAWPALTPESEALSRELRRRGFRGVGPTTAYAAMQSLGIVNDHLDGCHFWFGCDAERRAFTRPRGPLPGSC